MAATETKAGRPAGGSYKEKVQIDRNKPVTIDEEFEFPKYKAKAVDNTIKKFRCCMCGTVYTTQKGNFFKNGYSPLWRGNDGYLPICKTCVEAIYNDYVGVYSNNQEHALRHMCEMFDFFYCDSTSSASLAQTQKYGTRIAHYVAKAGMNQALLRGNVFADTLKEEQKEYYSAHTEKTTIEEKPEEEYVITKEAIKRWGKGYKPDEYRYLEEEYDDWIAKNVCNTKSQEEIYKNIVLAQLNIRIAQKNGGKVSEAQKALQDLMSSAAILPRQTADNVLADTQTFGTLLKKYEDTDPIPEPDEKWKDVDGIRKYMNAWFRGGLAKALKIKNENSELYDEEVEEYKKYTVTKKTADEQEDVSGYASIFDTDKKEGT